MVDTFLKFLNVSLLKLNIDIVIALVLKLKTGLPANRWDCRHHDSVVSGEHYGTEWDSSDRPPIHPGE